MDGKVHSKSRKWLWLENKRFSAIPKVNSKSQKWLANLKSDYNPDEKSDTGKKSDKIEINPTLEDESKRK